MSEPRYRDDPVAGGVGVSGPAELRFRATKALGAVRLPAPSGVPVLIVAVTTAVLLVRAARYDWFGDELYFVVAGYHPAAGYVDQGPLIPMFARAADTLAPGSRALLRLPAVLAGTMSVLVTAWLAREFGGGRGARILAALGYASCPYLITQTASLSTFALDSTATAIVIWLLVRWVRLRADRLLVVAGVVAAIDLQVKLLLPVFAVALGIGFGCCGPRTLVRRPALWIAAGIAGVSAAPALLWQWRHDWPQLAMGAVIRAEQQAATGGTAGLPMQLVLMAGVLGVVLIGCGTHGLLTELRPYRFLAVAAVLVVLFVAVTGGRPYYAAGLLPALFAAGAVVTVRRWPVRWWRAGVATAATTSVAIAATVVLGFPSGGQPDVVTTRAELSTRMRVSGTTGWNDLVAGVVRAVGRSGTDRAQTAILTRTYWQAAALSRLGGPDLPPVYSPNRGFAEFGHPGAGTTTIVSVDTDAAESRLTRVFATVEPVERLDDPHGFPGIDAHVTLWRCSGPRDTWDRLWPLLTTDVMDPGI